AHLREARVPEPPALRRTRVAPMPERAFSVLLFADKPLPKLARRNARIGGIFVAQDRAPDRFLLEVGIAAEDLVRALAGDADLVALAPHEPGKHLLGDRARVHERDLDVIKRALVLISHRGFAAGNGFELSTEVPRDLSRESRFIVAGVAEAHVE